MAQRLRGARADGRAARDDVLGLLPALGGSLSGLAGAGQLGRLLDYYLPAYLEHFRELRFFSYEPEELAGFTSDPTLLRRVTVVAPERRRQRHARAIELGRGMARALVRQCAAIRVFQAPGAVPAALSATTFVCTYGYDYTAPTHVQGPPLLAAAVLPAKRTAIRAMLRFVLARATATIVTSSAGAEQARRLGAARIETIPNGIDTAVFSTMRAEPEYDVTYVGQLVPGKDVPTLVRAAASTARHVRLCIVGAGPQQARLEALCKAHGLDAAFTGAVDNRQVADILARSRCFVLPSLSEGQPKALLEALAAGVPSVATDLPAVRELAATGAVRLFSPGDARGLAEAIEAVLDDPALARDLSGRGRRLVEERFEIHGLIQLDAALMREIADGASRGAGAANVRSTARERA